MERWKAAMKKLLFPGGGWVLLAVLLGGASLALTFLIFGEVSPFAYLFYLLSAYALTILVAAVVPLFPAIRYEAASMDGSTGVHAFFHITIPLLSPMIFFIVQTGVMGSLNLFDLPFMIMDKTSRVWPSVKTISYLFYEYAFEQSNRGYGAAIVMFLIAIIGILTVILQKTEKKWVHYD